MGFQTAVAFNQAAGVIGEFYDDSPRRVQSYILNSVSEDNNVFGRCFTIASEGVAACGNVGAAYKFAGFLVDPKTHPLQGDTTGSLAPSLTLPNYAQADLCTMGKIWVYLPAAAAIGDKVVYDNTTGELSTITNNVLPVGSSFAFAVVSNFTVSGAGLAVVEISPTLVIPQLA